jgi:hypothetical protein
MRRLLFEEDGEEIVISKQLLRNLLGAFQQYNAVLHDIRCELGKQTDLLANIMQHQLLISSTSEENFVLSLPKHLQQTWIALKGLNEATAEQVAAVTKRARAVESAYLNQLAVMGAASKERRGRKAFFHPLLADEGER